MKILHAADLHLDTPFAGRPEHQIPWLKQQLLTIPGQLVRLCRREGCDMMLLSGDLFDGPWTADSLDALRDALRDAEVPVFISPGNHDFCAPNSPYLTETWPENVHIFTKNHITSLTLPELDCRVYGAGFESMDCASLLEGFRAEGPERYHIATLHGDPTQIDSAYCPVTAAQVRESGLHYLALGHVHKTGFFRGGETLCAWPGCPMGRGYDEPGTKGVLIVTVEATAEATFVPLEGPKFFDEQIPVGTDPMGAVNAILPAAPTEDIFRVTLTGEAEPPNLEQLRNALSHIPNLELRDKTVPPVDIWSALGADSLEGAYFRLLHDACHAADDAVRAEVELAARISRQILDGREVVLP
jgi:DNA repair exonuclease SbcCD nuclease subunit